MQEKFGEKTPYGRLMYGVVEPDYNRVDDHELHVITLRGIAPGGGGAAVALKEFASQAEELLKKGTDLGEVLFVMGQATHFIQDLNQPLHAAWGETAQEHAAYESRAFYRDWPGKKYGYRGFYVVKSYTCFAYDTANNSSRYAWSILSGAFDERLIEITWDQAVNDTVNLWLSIFWRALGPEKAQALYGIPEPKGMIGKGWFC